MAVRSDYRQLLIDGTPLFDVRAPVEFNQGAFPGAVNLPLMDDRERELVGTCYKEQGPDAALALGHQLVQGELKQTRVAAWAAFADANPNGALYCFRGGQRSRISQQWMQEAGIDYPFVEGGYKALRRFLIDETERLVQHFPLVLVGGMTGTGKTVLLDQVVDSVDLEGLAHHRGSSFGRHATAQPTQISFENALAVELLRHEAASRNRLVLEDEGRIIGSVHLPHTLHDLMQQAPVLLLEDSLEARVDRILDEYVVKMTQEFEQTCAAELAFAAFSDYLTGALGRIKKRLGLERYQALAEQMNGALAEQQRDGDVNRHRDWIQGLLEGYYDPMYRYQLEKKTERIVYRGTSDELIGYLGR